VTETLTDRIFKNFKLMFWLSNFFNFA
jgi:hypothetical protein